MKNENKVLACVDQSHFAEYVADYAAWAARRMDAPLEFLHVIDRHPEQASGEDHSGAIGIDAQENLLSKLSAEDEIRTKNAREQGRLFLNHLRERAIAAGAEQVDVRQRHGELEETLAEQEEGVRLLVLGRHGEAAETTQRDLGRNVERVVRALHKPILTVTEGFKEPQRVMIAFDGGNVTRRGVEMVARLLGGTGRHGERLQAAKAYEWVRDRPSTIPVCWSHRQYQAFAKSAEPPSQWTYQQRGSRQALADRRIGIGRGPTCINSIF